MFEHHLKGPPIRVDRYGWNKFHVMDEAEHTHWRILIKLYKLTFSPNAQESGTALKKFEAMLRNNPYQYLPAFLDLEIPDFRSRHARKLAPGATTKAKRIKKFNVVAEVGDAQYKTITNKKALKLLDILTFMGWLHYYDTPERQRRKKFWLSFDQMLTIRPDFRKGSEGGEEPKDPKSSLRSLFYREFKYNRFPIKEGNPRRNKETKTREGKGEVQTFLLEVHLLPLLLPDLRKARHRQKA